jgi:hypothetical protein
MKGFNSNSVATLCARSGLCRLGNGIISCGAPKCNRLALPKCRLFPRLALG